MPKTSTVCRERYENGVLMGRLPCQLVYHNHNPHALAMLLGERGRG